MVRVAEFDQNNLYVSLCGQSRRKYRISWIIRGGIRYQEVVRITELDPDHRVVLIGGGAVNNVVSVI